MISSKETQTALDTIAQFVTWIVNAGDDVRAERVVEFGAAVFNRADLTPFDDLLARVRVENLLDGNEIARLNSVTRELVTAYIDTHVDPETGFTVRNIRGEAVTGVCNELQLRGVPFEVPQDWRERVWPNRA